MKAIIIMEKVKFLLLCLFFTFLASCGTSNSSASLSQIEKKVQMDADSIATNEDADSLMDLF